MAASSPGESPTAEQPTSGRSAKTVSDAGGGVTLDRSRSTHGVSGTQTRGAPRARENSVSDGIILDRSSNIYNIGASKYSINSQPYPRSAEYLPAMTGSSQQQGISVFKLLPATMNLSQAESLTNFMKSNRLAARRQGMTTYIGLDQIDGRFYLIRDYSNHRCLIDALDLAPFSDRAVESLVIQIAQNLGTQQPHGAIHPGNIFVAMSSAPSQELPFGTVELTDHFIDQIKNYLALINPEFDASYSSTVGLNPDYVPDDRSVEDRAVRDVYGLAAVAFELLTGRPTDFPTLKADTESFPEFTMRFSRKPDEKLAKALTLVAKGAVKTVAQLIDTIKGRQKNSGLKSKLFS
jgi:hypothetical protein